MATLADSFLADLDDLSDNEDLNEEPAGDENGDAGGGEGDDDDDEAMPDLEALNYDDLDAVAKLQKSQRYKDIIKRVDEAMKTSGEELAGGLASMADPEAVLIVECNALAVDIDNEVAIVHNFIRDKYRPKFPELESLVLHPIDYARVVSAIGNEMDLTLVDLEGLLPSATIMVVSVTASTTNGRPLDDDSLARVREACARSLDLDASKKRLLAFVESRMVFIAPNLSAIVGSAVAAQLMGQAGGLPALAAMPACNVQVLGAKKKNLAGFSTATALPHTGYVFHTELVQGTPPGLRLRACRLVAGKCTLAARRVDEAMKTSGEELAGGLASMADPEAVLIVECNALAVDIDNEVAIVHNFIRDKYRPKFPELESLVLHPIDYARVVSAIGNEMDLTLVDLEGLLPSATIMVVSVTASTTNGRPLDDDSLARVREACARSLDLDASKKRLLAFVESRMVFIAPNLSAIVGSAVAAQLMGQAGGLPALAAMPACNVQVLGAKKKNLAGFSTATALPHTGYVFHTELVQGTPPGLRLRACRLVAGKCTLAARGYGMLGQAGSGKLRMAQGQNKLAIKAAKKFKEKSYGSSGATSGLSSSLAFTPVQGIELSNPQPQVHGQLGGGTQSTYFSETGSFSFVTKRS
eukprot:jgi/Mesen1/3627/ME000020S03163